jgi:hypothetical protein
LFVTHVARVTPQLCQQEFSKVFQLSCIHSGVVVIDLEVFGGISDYSLAAARRQKRVDRFASISVVCLNLFFPGEA